MFKKLSHNKKDAQVTLEFAFSFIVLLLLLYGAMMAFRWGGVNLAERRISHEEILTRPVDEWWDDEINPHAGPLGQLEADFYQESAMNMVFNRW